MTTINDGDENDGSGLAGAKGTTSTDKTATTTPAATTAATPDGDKIAGAQSTPSKLGSHFRSNVGGIMMAVVSAGIFGPPVVIGGGGTLYHWSQGNSLWGSAMTAASQTKQFWQYEAALVGGLLFKYPANFTAEYIAPPVKGLLHIFGMADPAGPQSQTVVYCAPLAKVTGATAQDAKRVYDEELKLEERARTMVEEPGGRVQRLLKSGGFPVLVGHFSATVGEQTTPYQIEIINAGSAQNMACPAGNFKNPLPWALNL